MPFGRTRLRPANEPIIISWIALSIIVLNTICY
jgi:hypothetical protein